MWVSYCTDIFPHPASQSYTYTTFLLPKGFISHRREENRELLWAPHSFPSSSSHSWESTFQFSVPAIGSHGHAVGSATRPESAWTLFQELFQAALTTRSQQVNTFLTTAPAGWASLVTRKWPKHGEAKCESISLAQVPDGAQIRGGSRAGKDVKRQ